MPTRKARYVIDVIVDAKSTTRRCYRDVGANKSKCHPEAFFTGPVVTARGYRFRMRHTSVTKSATNRYPSFIR
jgi:hypothetical protein